MEAANRGVTKRPPMIERHWRNRILKKRKKTNRSANQIPYGTGVSPVDLRVLGRIFGTNALRAVPGPQEGILAHRDVLVQGPNFPAAIFLQWSMKSPPSSRIRNALRDSIGYLTRGLPHCFRIWEKPSSGEMPHPVVDFTQSGEWDIPRVPPTETIFVEFLAFENQRTNVLQKGPNQEKY